MKIRKFWEADPYLWDTINNVGLRNHYFCSVYAARLMVKNKNRSRLIANISSIGGGTYLFGVAYEVGKGGCDRMAADMGRELKPYGGIGGVCFNSFGIPMHVVCHKIVKFLWHCIPHSKKNPRVWKISASSAKSESEQGSNQLLPRSQGEYHHS